MCTDGPVVELADDVLGVEALMARASVAGSQAN
jgi:hypothetical protein